MLPNGWKKVKLGDIATISSGSTPLRSNKAYFENGNMPWVKTMDLTNGKITKTDECITELAAKKCKPYPPGTVLVAMYGGFNQIGRTGLLTFPASINQALAALQFDKDICSEYVLFYLNANVNCWRSCAASSRKDPNITSHDVEKFKIVLPPLEEQKKIAEILATQDRVIELKEKLIAEKQSQKKYLSQMLLTGKKRVGDYKDHWEYSALSNYLTIKDVRQIPNDEAPLMAFIAGMGGSPKGERYDRSFLVKNDKKEYKRTDLNDFIYSSNNLDVGSIGLNSYGSASISVVYEIFSVNSNAVPVVLSSIIQLPENLNYALRFRQGAIYGQYRIYAEDFLSMKIKIPSLPEQKAIADVLSAADEEISLLQKDLEQEKLKKKSLMQLLLTGLVRVQ